jgi:hypothetical protein
MKGFLDLIGMGKKQPGERNRSLCALKSYWIPYRIDPEQILSTANSIFVDICVILKKTFCQKASDIISNVAKVRRGYILLVMLIHNCSLRYFDEVFKLNSYCGGIPEKAACDNPLKYKISWNIERTWLFKRCTDKWIAL